MVVFLLGIGIILIILNVIAIKKESNSFKYTLENTEKGMNDFQVEIGKLRNEIGESILDLQKEIEEIKNTVQYVKNNEHNEIDQEEKVHDITENNNVKTHKESIEAEQSNNKVKENQEKSEKENRPVLKENSVKIEQIGSMINSGMSVEEVAEKLNIGKGEVLLIKELYLK